MILLSLRVVEGHETVIVKNNHHWKLNTIHKETNGKLWINMQIWLTYPGMLLCPLIPTFHNAKQSNCSPITGNQSYQNTHSNQQWVYRPEVSHWTALISADGRLHIPLQRNWEFSVHRYYSAFIKCKSPKWVSSGKLDKYNYLPIFNSP